MIEFSLPFQAETVDERFATMLDWDLDPNLYSSLIVMGVLLLLGIVVGISARRAYKREDYKKRPKGLMFYAEQYVNFVDRFAINTMGHDVFSPWGGYFFTLFAYLFVAFNVSLFGLPSVIDWMAAPLSLAIVMFVIIQYQGLKWSKWSYFHRYIEPIAVFLPVNLVTMWSPILSTTMRMFGNAISGTVIIGLVQWAFGNLSGAIFGPLTEAARLNYVPFWDSDQSTVWTQIFLAPIPIGILNIYFSLFSGGVQTLVFCSLNAVWIAAERPVEDDSSPALLDRERMLPADGEKVENNPKEVIS